MPDLRDELDDAVAGSRSFDELVGRLETLTPHMAERIHGKALIEARSPLAIVAFYALGAILGHRALHLDAGYTLILAGVFVFLSAYAARIYVNAPITGILRQGPV